MEQWKNVLCFSRVSVQPASEQPSLDQFCPHRCLCLNGSHETMLHQNVLEPGKSALAIIDMQEAFRESIANFTAIAERIAIMVEGAVLLNVPLIVTEQYPKGLGHTASEITSVLPPTIEIIEKTTFSSCGAQSFQSRLEALGTRHVIVCGIEAHICVNQTVHDLLASGFRVHLLTDCVGSRNISDRKTATRKMQMSGAIFSTVEMGLFELMRDSKHEKFREIQRLIK